MELSKQTLRHEAIRHRNRIDVYDKSEDPDIACASFFDNIKPAAGKVVGLYWPEGKEFSTASMLERLLSEGFVCGLPVVNKDREIKEMKFARWQEGDPLERNQFKVLQPVTGPDTEWLEPDILIVPLLAFDRRGYRLGYGGGHYDATISALREKKDIIAVGVAYAKQAVLFNLPAEPHDQKLDWVITPQQAYCYEDK